MVGAVRFELTTSCTRNKRASQTTLRPEPVGHIKPESHRRINDDFSQGDDAMLPSTSLSSELSPSFSAN